MGRVSDHDDDLRSLVTLIIELDIEIFEGRDISPEQRRQYSGLFRNLGLSAESDRDLALLAGATEIAKWVIVSAEQLDMHASEVWEARLKESK